MSDLQMLTGISILISGYVQLKCGLSCFHWELLVYLAYFSNLTHQACLTFVRNYLYLRPGQRLWRLFFMSVLVLMLVVALYPTGDYGWDDIESYQAYASENVTRTLTQHGLKAPQPGDYAICYLWKDTPNGGWRERDAHAQMLISVLLVVLGFVVRIVRTHKVLSVDVVQKTRKRVSDRVLRRLRRVYTWCDPEHSPHSLWRSFMYRPLLASFLITRVCVEALSSMFFEVSLRYA